MDDPAQTAVETGIQAARDAGVPLEQAWALVNAGYTPYKWQWKFHAAAREADKKDGPVQIGVGGARGPGKALALDTPIPTPSGWTTMGDIKVWDKVFGPDGMVTVVTGVSGIQDGRKCFDVEFSDGAVITADAEHLWLTQTKQDRVATVRRSAEFREKRRSLRSDIHKEWLQGKNVKHDNLSMLRTTKEIKDTLYAGKEINHSVFVAKPLSLLEAVLPIDPYVLGAWLGDGHSEGGKITCFDDQIVEEIGRIFQTYRLKTDGLYRIEGLTSVLSICGLLKNKHIPAKYLRASVVQRVALIQGLNDTDGYVDRDGSVEFTTTNRQIAEGMFELVLSLGQKATCREGVATLNGKEVGKKWRIRYTASFPAFRLTRKLVRQNQKRTKICDRRFIVDVRERESVSVQCITVDHPSRCFLAGKQFIPTHNSHAIFSQITLDDCQRQPNLKALFLRQTGKAAKESMDDLVARVLAGKLSYEHTQSVLRFPNGSRVILGGFQNEKDIDKYVGIEYDAIGIEEENQLSETKVEMLRGSLRTSKDGWRPRLYASFNPGGIGHGYVKSTFIEPFRSGLERSTRYIPATYRDNPNLNQEYVEYLEGLQGQLGQAWREGDFNILAGQFFTEFNEKLHVVEPFPIPDSWRKFASLDYGFTAPSALYWLAVSPEGQVFVYREFYQSGFTYSRLAEEFVARTPATEKIEYLVCDPSIWNKDGKDDQGLSGAEIFERRCREMDVKVRLERGNNDRVQGWATAREFFRPYQTKDPKTAKEKVTAKLQIFNICPNLIRTIPLQIHDERNPEDLDTEVEDHGIDSIRYGLMSRPRPSTSAAQKEELIFKQAMKRKKMGSVNLVYRK